MCKKTPQNLSITERNSKVSLHFFESYSVAEP